MVDHVTEHDICPDCWLAMNPDEPSVDGLLVADAARCCWCGNHTRTGLTAEAPAEEVPRHRRDPEWLASAGFTPDELSQPDPREVRDQ